jgi:hypothetical protein
MPIRIMRRIRSIKARTHLNLPEQPLPQARLRAPGQVSWLGSARLQSLALGLWLPPGGLSRPSLVQVQALLWAVSLEP